MNIAFCYENVLPTHGGCETYIADLSRRLVADRHDVHLYACRWDAEALPPELTIHAIPPLSGPRFLRPWRFAAACERALTHAGHQVTVGFDKTWGQDVLYPQGGLHSASASHNLGKHPGRISSALAWLAKSVDLAHWSYSFLERRQYLREPHPLVVVNSNMVQRHYEERYDTESIDLRVVHSAVDPDRFLEHDRPRRRLEWRQAWGIRPEETVALFVAMNYRLKGLVPLLHAVQRLPAERIGSRGFRLLVVGDPRTRRYERLAERLGIRERVQFIGHNRETRNCYFASDFLVHPTFYDPCSLVVLEALTCGLPVITSQFNGASELLSPPREGYVIADPHDHERLAGCMAMLLDPARRAACSQAARKTSAQWTFDHHYRRMLQIFTEAAARKRAA